MEEKKLTDEEIVKALGNCENLVACEGCLLKPQGCIGLALDLIHRLQADNIQLKCDTYKTSWKGKFLEAKKEIERLTEELDLANETIDRNNKRYERMSIERQKALDRVDCLEDALLDKIRRNEEIITAIKQAEQQAVKDTAKEILQTIKRAKENGQIHYNEAFMITAQKAYGVEVE